jgi:arginase family enzyme
VRSLAGDTLVGADVVEVSPPYDGPDRSPHAAANLAFEILSVMALER